MADFLKRIWILTILLFASACGDGRPAQEEGEDVQPEEALLHVYSPNAFQGGQAVFQRFTRETGIEVTLVRGGADELLQRLRQEGPESPADLLITVDAGRLHRAKVEGLFQPVRSRVLEANIPVHLRDPAGEWFGLLKRARVIAFSKQRVRPQQLSGYQDLARSRWKGKVLTGSSGDLFTQALAASLLLASSRQEVADWARGVVANMAAPPPAGDRLRIQALAAGEADLALVNTSSLALMLDSDDPQEVEAAQAAGLFFPDQEGRGAHVNVSAAGVARHAPHPANAVRLLEFLSGEDAQKELAAAGGDYPVKPDVDWPQPLQQWGRFKEDPVSLAVLGLYTAEAAGILREAEWP